MKGIFPILILCAGCAAHQPVYSKLSTDIDPAHAVSVLRAKLALEGQEDVDGPQLVSSSVVAPPPATNVFAYFTLYPPADLPLDASNYIWVVQSATNAAGPWQIEPISFDVGNPAAVRTAPARGPGRLYRAEGVLP